MNSLQLFVKTFLFDYPRLLVFKQRSSPGPMSQIIRTAFGFGMGQVESEITHLAEMLCQNEVHTALEIGTYRGGSLFVIANACADDALIMTLDLPWEAARGRARTSNGYPLYRRGLYRAFAREEQVIVPLQMSSVLESTREKVCELLDGRPLDFLLIDGGHSPEVARSDWDMYSPLVRKGGVIAIHDIGYSLESSKGGAALLWRDVVKSGYTAAKEIVHRPDLGSHGFGIVEI